MSKQNTTVNNHNWSRLFYLYWLFNFVYTIIYWGGWYVVWNFFVPYAAIYDACLKYGHYIRPK